MPNCILGVVMCAVYTSRNVIKAKWSVPPPRPIPELGDIFCLWTYGNKRHATNVEYLFVNLPGCNIILSWPNIRHHLPGQYTFGHTRYIYADYTTPIIGHGPRDVRTGHNTRPLPKDALTHQCKRTRLQLSRQLTPKPVPPAKLNIPQTTTTATTTTTTSVNHGHF